MAQSSVEWDATVDDAAEKGHEPMSRSKFLPVPLPAERQPARQAGIIVVEQGQGARGSTGQSSRALAPLARIALDLAPDLLRAFERTRTQRSEVIAIPAAQALRPRNDRRSLTSGVHLSEVELDVRVPFVRRVTVRKATAWTTDMPIATGTEIALPARGSRLRRAGVVSVGGAVAVAAVGLIVRART